MSAPPVPIATITPATVHTPTISTPAATASPIDPATEEQVLYKLLNEYRVEQGLATIPYSSKLALTARLHAEDLASHRPDQAIASDGQACNLHSWSEHGNWTPVCYTSDHRESKKMWRKPAEIAGYSGNGYEISAYSPGCHKATCFLDIWRASSGHNDVIINAGIWADQSWQAVGVGITGDFAHIWFGHEPD